MGADGQPGKVSVVVVGPPRGQGHGHSSTFSVQRRGHRVAVARLVKGFRDLEGCLARGICPGFSKFNVHKRLTD